MTKQQAEKILQILVDPRQNLLVLVVKAYKHVYDVWPEIGTLLQDNKYTILSFNRANASYRISDPIGIDKTIRFVADASGDRLNSKLAGYAEGSIVWLYDN